MKLFVLEYMINVLFVNMNS